MADGRLDALAPASPAHHASGGVEDDGQPSDVVLAGRLGPAIGDQLVDQRAALDAELRQTAVATETFVEIAQLGASRTGSVMGTIPVTR